MAKELTLAELKEHLDGRFDRLEGALILVGKKLLALEEQRELLRALGRSAPSPGRSPGGSSPARSLAAKRP